MIVIECIACFQVDRETLDAICPVSFMHTVGQWSPTEPPGQETRLVGNHFALNGRYVGF